MFITLKKSFKIQTWKANQSKKHQPNQSTCRKYNLPFANTRFMVMWWALVTIITIYSNHPLFTHTTEQRVGLSCSVLFRWPNSGGKRGLPAAVVPFALSTFRTKSFSLWVLFTQMTTIISSKLLFHFSFNQS